jgi:long-chain acyl-CoA synthetase
MDLSKLAERMESAPERGISFYGEGGRIVRRSYPAVCADVREVVERLRGWGVREGMRVGVLATNSYEWVVHDLALLELGCTSVAFPEEFGGRSARELIEKYGLGLLLVSRKDNWPNLAPDPWTVYMDADNPPHVSVHPAAPRDAGGESVPSLTFSSGTSGRIKCLITNRRGAEQTVESFYRRFDINGDDSFLVFLPLSSFQQRLMVYAGFFYGFDLLLASPQQVLAAFREMRPTLCLAPPLLYETIHAQFDKAVSNLGAARRLMLRVLSALAQVVPVAAARERLLRACYGKIYEALGGRVRLLWTGMAPIKGSTLDFFARTRLPLCEAYGLTECGAITSNTPRHNRRGSVGRPIVDGSVFLVEDGEIMVRLEHLQTTGYLECDVDEEARTYVAPGTIATGDIGEFDRDGFLYLKGRKKEIIVTGQGYKVHPESLESVIDRNGEVGRSVVFGTGLPYLVALISARGPVDEAVEERIRKGVERVNARLPPAARIVRHHVTAEQLTRENGFMTRNLKLDRRAVFRHFRKELCGGDAPAVPQAAAAGEPAQTETESRVAAIWQDVLGVALVRAADNFFDLGGNSLLLAEVQRRVQAEFGRDVPLVDMFDNATVAGLSKYLSAAPGEEQAAVQQQAADRAGRRREAVNRQRQMRARA